MRAELEPSSEARDVEGRVHSLEVERQYLLELEESRTQGIHVHLDDICWRLSKRTGRF